MTKNPFHELTYYTLAHPDQIYFIHQHAVDAWTAQTATPQTKPIGVAFSLAGLCLFVEKGYTGRQVQQAHLKLSTNKPAIPAIHLPDNRGRIGIEDVLLAEPGEIRDETIKNWCRSLWAAFTSVHPVVHEWLARELAITF